MIKWWDCVPQELVPWIKKQEMFFVATAPLSGSGHVNLSPKGLRGTLHVVDKTRVWYEDLSGSGMSRLGLVHGVSECSSRQAQGRRQSLT